MTWEERYHPLRQEWVIVAAHRGGRPWSGATIDATASREVKYSPDCYLCPGNPRVSGAQNPRYEGVFVFDNDHPCVGPKAPAEPEPAPGFYRNRPARGVARVVCYSPLHNLTLAELQLGEVSSLLKCWQDQYRELSSHPDVNHVLIFENKGEAVGVSNPHPHCQIYATNFVFKTLEVELQAERNHLAATGQGLMQQILETELADGRRVIAKNEQAIAFLPYFARYSYETYVVPTRRHSSIATLNGAELDGLAAVLQEVVVRFDNLWRMPFPYVMVLHQAPTDGEVYDYHHFHIQFHPPLRAPNLLKYLAGPEVGGGCFVSDSAPEAKAEELRQVSAVHYKAADSEVLK